MGRHRARNNKWEGPHRELNFEALGGIRASEIGPDGEPYQVRSVRGGTKEYRCPGCDQVISPGTAHVVVWPEGDAALWERGVSARRHWHTHCWRRRLRPS